MASQDIDTNGVRNALDLGVQYGDGDNVGHLADVARELCTALDEARRNLRRERDAAHREVADRTADEWLTGAEVARLFGVNAKTVTRWANEGKLNASRTLGGHRRFSRAEIQELLDRQ